jgi:aspartate/tyrosine/aromatic aminotransferase
VDPNPEQWAEISKIAKKKNFLVFFDVAYQVHLPLLHNRFYLARFPYVFSAALIAC